MRRQPVYIRKSSGAALILVLGVLAIMTVLTVQINDSAKKLTNQQFSLKQLQQSYWYAKSGEEYARLESRKYVTSKYIPEDKRSIIFPIEDGSIEINTTLMQNCFNLNSFSQRSALKVKNRLNNENPPNSNNANNSNENDTKNNLQGVELKRQQLNTLFNSYSINTDQSTFFADRLIDWLDADNIPTGNYGAENTYYASAHPARLTPNQHLFNLSEIHQFLEKDHQDFTAVEDILCTRPGDNQLRVNINQLDTSNALLISAILLGNVNNKTALSIIENRPKEGFSSLDEFWQLTEFKDININAAQKNAFSIENRYFQIETKVNYLNSKFSLISLLRINDDKSVDIISRQYGVIS